MTVAQLYPHLQDTLNAAQLPNEVAYSPSLGYHLAFTGPDGVAYKAVHPDETVHGNGWDLYVDNQPALFHATESALRFNLAAAWANYPDDQVADDIVADYARRYPSEPPLRRETAQLAHAIWKATPTPPMGLRLARAAA